MKCFKFLLIVLSALVIVSCSDDDEPIKSSENKILSFKIGEFEKTNPAENFELNLPFETDVTKLSPIISLSEKATISPKSEQEQDFTNPVTYTVTAEDGITRKYLVSIILGEAPNVEIEEVESSYIAQGKTITLKGTFAKQKDLNKVVLIKNVNQQESRSVATTSQEGIALEVVSLSGDFKTLVVRVPNDIPQGEYTLQVSVGDKVATYDGVITILDPNGSILEGIEEGKEYLIGDSEWIEVTVKNLLPSPSSYYEYAISLMNENAEPYMTRPLGLISIEEVDGGSEAILRLEIGSVRPGVNYIRIIGADNKQTNPVKIIFKENTYSAPEINEVRQDGDYIVVTGKGFMNKSDLKSIFFISPESRFNLDWMNGHNNFNGWFDSEIRDLTETSFKINLKKMIPFRSFVVGAYVDGKISSPSKPINPAYPMPTPILKSVANPLTAGVSNELEIYGEGLSQLENIGKMIDPDRGYLIMYAYIHRKDEQKRYMTSFPFYINEITNDGDGEKIISNYNGYIFPSNFPAGTYHLYLVIDNLYLTNTIDIIIE